MMATERSKLRARLFSALRVLAGLAILLFVARELPWTDSLSFQDAEGATHAVEGTIEGEWQDDRVRFHVEDDAVLAGFPDELRRSAADGTVEVERGARADGSSFDWKPGMPRAFGDLERTGLIEALGFFLLGQVIAVTRWWRLLALAECRTSWFNAMRLTLLGMFFNIVVPGLTGGDVVRAAIVVRENPAHRADAFVSVIVDRLLGLGTLAILAAVVIFVSGDTFDDLRRPLIWSGVAAAVLFVLYTQKTLRKKLGLSWVVDRVPLGSKLRSLDRAAFVYLRHPFELAFAFVLSAANHFAVVLGVFCLGLAFGVPRAEVGLGEYLVLVPVANIVSALPLAPGGWGLGEFVYKELFEMIDANATMGVAISVTFRLCQLAIGLLGGVFLLLPGAKPSLDPLEAAPSEPAA